MADTEGFVRRWSRRKSAARVPLRPAEPEPAAPAAPAPAEAAVTPAVAPPETPGQDAAAGTIDPASLPDLETMTYQSDFTVFMQAGVPAELRKRALQQLWRSDPVFGHLDGLVEYGEDYSHVGITPQIVRTAYQVGRGMLDRIEAAAAPSPVEPEAVEPPAPKGGDAAVAEPALIEGSASEDANAGGSAEAPPASPPPLPKRG